MRQIAASRFAFFCVYGGYPGAERTMIGFFPGEIDDPEASFPIARLAATCRGEGDLTHRDFLGALLGLGIERRSIGDILTEPGRAVMFVSESIAPFVEANLEKVGRHSVAVSRDSGSPLPAPKPLLENTAVISSARLDCVAAAILGVSRGAAADLITAGRCQIGHRECLSVSKPVAEGDTLSIRGQGRFVVLQCREKTKKGRIRLVYGKAQ